MAHFEAGERMPDVRRHLRKNPLQKLIEQAKRMFFIGNDKDKE